MTTSKRRQLFWIIMRITMRIIMRIDTSRKICHLTLHPRPRAHLCGIASLIAQEDRKSLLE